MIHSNQHQHTNLLLHRSKKGILISGISIIANILLAIFKYWIGFQIASIAIIAEAWHSFSDSLTSIIALISFKMTTIPPDKKHPFGHGRTEVIASLVIGVILSIIAFNFFTESVKRLILRESVQYNQTAFIIFIISLAVKEILAQISIKIGRKIKSKVLIADGWHHRSDALASIIVIIGIFLNPYAWWVDSIMGIIISFIIGYIAFDILKNTISSLIGEKPSDSFINQLQQIVEKSTHYQAQPHHIHLHRYGQHKELTFHIFLPGEMKLEQAHQIATQLEERVNQALGVETTIHIENLDDKKDSSFH